MSLIVKMSKLRGMMGDEREATMSSIVAASRQAPNGEISRLSAQIQAFEEQHSMTSDELRSALRKREVRETAEICRWLMLLDLRERLEPSRSSTSP